MIGLRYKRKTNQACTIGRGDVQHIWLNSDKSAPEGISDSLQGADSCFVALHIGHELSSKEDAMYIANLTKHLRSTGYTPLLGKVDPKSAALLHIFDVLRAFENVIVGEKRQTARRKSRFLRLFSDSSVRPAKSSEMIRSAAALMS